MREIPESIVRGIMDPFVSPRGGRFPRPQIKASWLKDPEPVEAPNTMASSAEHDSEPFSVTPFKHARLVGRADAQFHSQPGAFALTQANELNLHRPGSARVESARSRVTSARSETGMKSAEFARPRSANRKWFDNLSRPDDEDYKDRERADMAVALSREFSALNKPAEVHRVSLPDDTQEPSRRKMRKGRYSLADRLNSRTSIATEGHLLRRGSDIRERAQVARSVWVWQKVVNQRNSEKLTPGMIRKLHPPPVKKSMFQSCLSNPHGYGWPRPASAEGFAEDASSDGCCFSQLDSRCTSPTIEEIQMNLAMDATRFEKKYSCAANVDQLNLYRGPSSRSPSPQASRMASPEDNLRDPEIQVFAIPEWRPETPQLNYGEDVVLTVQQPGPPANLETHGTYHLVPKTPDVKPPYTTVALDLVPTNDTEQCPKFNVSTVRRWFDIVSLGTGVVRRRQLLLALYENEDIFCVFCGAELHKHIRSIEKTEGRRPASNRWKLTEASFDIRQAMMRRGLEVLDRIDWEWKQSHRDNRESRGRRLTSRGSMSRKMAFEVFLTYFKYMDMLLEYNDTPNLNWNWLVFREKDIAKGKSPEEFTRIAMEDLGSPTPPEDDGLDEDVIKDVGDAKRAFSGFRRRGTVAQWGGVKIASHA